MVKAVDFFCGAGGMTRGLLDAGIRVVLGVDCNMDCRETYERNNAPAGFLRSDIRSLPNDDFEDRLAMSESDELLFAGCAPCQPFSKQRTSARDEGQRTLLSEFSRLVALYRPEYVLVENVPGIRKIGGRSTYRRFLATLDRTGYQYDAADIDAKDYGAPQTRHRHVLLARRSSSVRIPPPTHGPGRRPYVTVRDAISRFPRIRAGETDPHVPNHRASGLSQENVERLRNTPPDGGDRRSWPDRLVPECHKGAYQGHTDVYGRMWWDRPAPALTCKCHSLSNGRYGHPDQDRALSLREAAALQTFPDSYVFYGRSKKSIGDQIGNAVPVAVAAVLGSWLVYGCGQSAHGRSVTVDVLDNQAADASVPVRPRR